MSTFRDDRRFGEHEALKRDPGPDFSDQAIAQQVAEFIARGGKVKQIPSGEVTEYKSPTARAGEVRREKKRKQDSQLMEIL
jgi:hypothetical protein